jgi:hypothetical protein
MMHQSRCHSYQSVEKRASGMPDCSNFDYSIPTRGTQQLNRPPIAGRSLCRPRWLCPLQSAANWRDFETFGTFEGFFFLFLSGFRVLLV